jgi:hypothetical protein
MVALIKPSFASGELAPALWGRTDLNKFQSGCSVARNVFVRYQGGVASRAGLAFVGQCKQPATAAPPRIVRFAFSIFQNYILEFGDQYMRVVANGAYVTETAFAVTGVSNADPGVVTIPGNNFADGDWIYFSGFPAASMYQLNAITAVVASVAGSAVTLNDTFGNPLDTTFFNPYTTGGTAARIFTLTTPYAAVDLPYLKFTQSADVMSLTCVNIQTDTEYPPQELTRHAANNWTIAPPAIGTSIGPPNPVSAIPSNPWSSGANPPLPGPVAYGYVVTAIDALTGDESVVSDIGVATNSVDIDLTFGTIVVTWNPPSDADAPNGISGYNIYKTTPDATNVGQFGGQLFGYVGSTGGATSWTDDNVIPDYTTVPPMALNPFARGQILYINNLVSLGTVTGATFTINTSTGSGAVLQASIIESSLTAVIVVDPGEDYAKTDTLTITVTGGGSATGDLVVGPESGTYPGDVAYFQQRRAYAATLNDPDTYQMSQPGSYLNFDAGTPPIDSDAISGDPWAQQVNGIQCMVPMPGGLIVGTGLDAWQLSGTGGAGTPITPSQQSASPQESYGFSATLQPIRISWHILYVPQVGTSIQDMEYNFWNNMYAGTEISILSSHLFLNYQIESWALARQPYKLIWMTRNDGKALSMTYMKEQEVVGITRHDTNGLFQSVAVATEPPVDAPYFVVKRYIAGEGQWAYYLERMDNRQWTNDPESTYCVDAGATLPLTQPNATLTASRAAPTNGCLPGNILLGGSNYSNAVQGIISDPGGEGEGAIVNSVTVVAGSITAFTIAPEGANYKNPQISFTDATGSGCVAQVLLDKSVTFTASAGVFSGANVGNVIRMGGGKATVTGVTSSTIVTANFLAPITETVPNDPNNLPVPAVSGSWSIAAPVTSVGGLDYLEGMTVTGLADGSVIPPQVVENGAINLSAPASAVTVGLGFIAQLQSMHTELGGGGETVQGKAIKIPGVTARIEGSGLFSIGQDQPIASQQANQAEYAWTNMTTVKSKLPVSPSFGVASPLFTGDRYISIRGDWNVYNPTPNDTVPVAGEAPRAPGMVAVQQDKPLPLSVLALVPDVLAGDTTDPSDVRG